MTMISTWRDYVSVRRLPQHVHNNVYIYALIKY